MSIVAFDTLKFANQLQAGNFTAEQAQAMTGAMVEAMAGAELATKHDIVAVKHDIAAVKAELKADIDAVKTELKAEAAANKAELKADIAGVEHRLEQKIDGVRLEISESQISTQRFILATVGINAVMVLGAMFGLAKLLGH